MSPWEIAAYAAGSVALLVLVTLMALMFVREGREHRAANEQIPVAHESVLEQARTWQRSRGRGTTEFPALRPARPSLLARAVGSLVQGWAVLSSGLHHPDQSPAPADRHTPAHARTPRHVAQQLADGSDVSDGQVAEAVDAGFVAAGLPGARAVGVAQVAERPSWEDIDRKRAEQDAWLADPDRTTRMPLVPARRDGVR